MTPEQARKLEELYAFMISMKRFDTVPREVGQALSRRLKKDAIEVSTKAANSEDVSINEAGSATQTVLNDPDLFLKVTTDTGQSYHVPAYHS